tara:strand:+ start:556 stop:864 length:309 start_codon:yes stop_codon:yes gene_type:complete
MKRGEFLKLFTIGTCAVCTGIVIVKAAVDTTVHISGPMTYTMAIDEYPQHIRRSNWYKKHLEYARKEFKRREAEAALHGYSNFHDYNRDQVIKKYMKVYEKK